MTSNEDSGSLPHLRSGPLITGSALVAAGGLIAWWPDRAGGPRRRGSHVLPVTPLGQGAGGAGELAKLKWAQATAAAGAGALQNGSPAQHPSAS